MRSTITALLVCATLTLAERCKPDSLIPISDNDVNLPSTYTLWARSANGSALPVTRPQFPEDGGFYYPLSLGAANLPLSDVTVPKIFINRGFAYAGGEVLSTKNNLEVLPVELYVSSDTSQIEHLVAVLNATCGGKSEMLLRLNNLLHLPLSAHLNESFVPGVGLNTPSVTGLLGLGGTPVDLILREYDD